MAQVTVAQLYTLKLVVIEDVPPTKKTVMSTSFQSAWDMQSALINPEDPSKMVQIGTALGSK